MFRKNKKNTYQQQNYDYDYGYNENNKYEYIQIRVSKDEKRQIQQLAKLQHLTVSSLIRWLILSKYKNDLFIDRS